MQWIKTKEKIPENCRSVLVSDKHGWVSIAHIEDVNQDKRDKARTRKDKYPIKMEWKGIITQNYCSEDYFPYWMELPTSPIPHILDRLFGYDEETKEKIYKRGQKD